MLQSLLKSLSARRLGLLLLCAALGLGAAAQDAPKTKKAKGAKKTAVKKAPAKPKFVTNTDEEKVGAVTLPDPLKMADGTAVASAEQWTAKRRPEVLALFQSEEYGRAPGELKDVKFEVTAVKKDALGGKATRKLVHISLEKHPAWGGMDLMVYTPNDAKGPVPAFAGLSFGGNHAVSTETDVPFPKNYKPYTHPVTPFDPEKTRGQESKSWPIETILGRGYAVATAWYGDIEPDHKEGWKDGLRGALAQDPAFKGWDAEKDWSAIGAWAWGLGRALDYLATDAGVDARRVAVIGHSRLGKTSSWAGASDDRFALVISNDSGEGGMALARRNFGETIQTMEVNFPYWFCAKHWSYVGKLETMPLDQHMLVALVAPRPMYIASGSEDKWADPRGEFLAGKGAEPVYALFGKKGLGVAEWPAADKPVGESIGYHLRTGPHGMTTYDWEQYLNFADRHIGKK